MPEVLSQTLNPNSHLPHDRSTTSTPAVFNYAKGEQGKTGQGREGKAEGILVQAGDEVLELVSEAGAHSLAGAAHLGCNSQAGHLLH